MKVTIIGGGAAGLMAAAALQEADATADITIVERNDALGKKVVISGGGRCNVTTGIHDVKIVLTKYPRGGKFLSSAIHRFPPEAVYGWFEGHGVPLKTEEDLRVFPLSDNGKDIVAVFDHLFATPRTHVLLKTHATRVEKQGDTFLVFLKNQSEPITTDTLVLTTGGQAYRHTGSTGDGYAFATSLGHSLTTLAPSLNAFFTRETWPHELAGVSFEWATLKCDRKPSYTFTGPFLFTHKGVSGPAVFALSSLVAFETYSVSEPLAITINLFPELPAAELYQKMQAFITTNPKKSLGNALATLVPKSLVEVLCRELQLDEYKHAGEVGKKDLTQALGWLQSIPLHVTARGAGDEFVTAGGVNLKEVDPTTMESKICPGLYLAGEILDVDGYTGGFNLQASWATGHLVGESIARSSSAV